MPPLHSNPCVGSKSHRGLTSIVIPIEGVEQHLLEVTVLEEGMGQHWWVGGLVSKLTEAQLLSSQEEQG